MIRFLRSVRRWEHTVKGTEILGLPIVKNLVDAMGGEISVNSQLGKGTEFTVKLYVPVAEEEKQETEEEKDTSTEKLKGDRILLVEDNEINIYVAQIILEKAGCIVTVARNGEEAVKLFQESDIYQFDAILMDVRMPIMMDWMQPERSEEWIARMHPEVPIIAMTADAFDEERRNTLEAGMDYHLSKPINPSILYKVLAEYIQ